MSWLEIVGVIWGVSALIVVVFYVTSLRESRKSGGS